MASSPSPAVRVTNYPHTSVKIAPEPDLTVRVYEYQDVYAPHGQLPPIKCVTDYAVSRAVLILRAGDMWCLKRKGLTKWFKGWFQMWWDKNAREEDLNGHTIFKGSKLARVLLYPCWVFGHAAGFAAVTKWLVYHSVSHITEWNPTKHRDLHLPPRIIEQLNAVRGRCKGLLHGALWNPIENPLKSAKCDCKEKTLFLYQRALFDINVWPLERTFSKTSVADLLGRLRTFQYQSEHKPCNQCIISCQKVVENAVATLKQHWDGLCLVCMARSEEKADHCYWHNDRMKNWDKDCRPKGVRHGQATWYYSYMIKNNYKEARKNWYKLNNYVFRYFDDDSDF